MRMDKVDRAAIRLLNSEIQVSRGDIDEARSTSMNWTDLALPTERAMEAMNSVSTSDLFTSAGGIPSGR